MPKDLLRAVARLTMAIVSTTTVLAVLPAAHAGNSSSLRSSTVAAPVADPAVKGPLATVRATYQLGNTALRVPTGYKVELAGEVTYPKALGRTRRPLVVLVPGAHAPCGRADGDKDDAWPCAKGFRPIPSERGFRPLADLLASHGMIVVSIAVNGVNAQDSNSDDEGARDRAHLILAHLDRWRSWSTSDARGPFGTRFRGTVDLGNIALLGHSRGGEGVVTALARNARRAVRYGIRAVVPVAASNTNRPGVRGTASLTVVPYCDGDIRDLAGVHYFDDAVHGPADRVPHAMVALLGANHNFFNTVWTPGGWEAATYDDGTTFENDDPACGKAHRLTAAQQIRAGNAYVAAFLRARLQGMTNFDVLFHGNTPVPTSAQPARVVAAFSGAAGNRLIVDDQSRPGRRNALGGAVHTTGFDIAVGCGGTTRYALICFGPRGRGDEPHLTPSVGAGAEPGLAQLHLAWSQPGASWHHAIPPAHSDVRRYRVVTVRVARDAWALTPAPPRLNLTLRDTAGRQQTLPLAGPALTTPVYSTPTGSDSGYSFAPHALSAGIAVPLAAFDRVDRSHVDSLTVTGSSPSGDITVADLSLLR